MAMEDLTVQVLNLAPRVTLAELNTFFSYCGTVQQIQLRRDADQLPHALVTFVQPYAFQTALLLDDATFGGQQIGVLPAHDIRIPIVSDEDTKDDHTQDATFGGQQIGILPAYDIRIPIVSDEDTKDDHTQPAKLEGSDAGIYGNHPYAPRDLKLPGFVPGFLSQSTIVGVYGVSSLLVVSLTWLFSGRSPRKSKLDRWLMCWWAFTGLTHLILEGYFAFAPEFYKDKTAWYPAEVWKEYSKGDSRYAARDAGVVAVEGLTAVIEGPASLLAVYAISKGKSYSYILQFAISLGQLYGTAVYFITAYLDGDKFATSSFYYYAYYIAANASWVVIPTLISIRCWKKISAAVQVQGQGQGQKKNKTR